MGYKNFFSFDWGHTKTMQLYPCWGQGRPNIFASYNYLGGSKDFINIHKESLKWLLILFHDSPSKYMLKAVFPFAAESSVQQPWLLCSYLTFSIDASHPSPQHHHQTN